MRTVGIGRPSKDWLLIAVAVLAEDVGTGFGEEDSCVFGGGRDIGCSGLPPSKLGCGVTTRDFGLPL